MWSFLFSPFFPLPLAPREWIINFPKVQNFQCEKSSKTRKMKRTSDSSNPALVPSRFCQRHQVVRKCFALEAFSSSCLHCRVGVPCGKRRFPHFVSADVVLVRFPKKRKTSKALMQWCVRSSKIVCISENNHVKFTIPFLFGFRILRVDGESVENPMGREFSH